MLKGTREADERGELVNFEGCPQQSQD